LLAGALQLGVVGPCGGALAHTLVGVGGLTPGAGAWATAAAVSVVVAALAASVQQQEQQAGSYCL
jgi:hypothetical protein